MQPYEQRSFTVANVFSEAFELYRRFFSRFAALSLIVFLAVDLVSALSTTTSSDTGRGIWLILGVVAGVIGFYWFEGAIVLQVDDVRDGRIDTTLAEVFERARVRLPYLIAAGFLVGAAIGIGALILVLLSVAVGIEWLGVLLAAVGALFLVTRLIAVAPAVVLDQLSPVEALRRSNEIVKGNSWRTFAIILVTGLFAGVVSGILAGILRALLGTGFIGVWLGSAIPNALTAPFLAIAWILVYFHLKSK